MALTREQREALSSEDFAVPARRALPIQDPSHVRMAFSQIMRAAGLSDEERAEGRARIAAKAEVLGVDLQATVKEMRFEEPLSAMALEMPAGDHPNKMSFTGILTHLDTPSDKAPNGSKGRKVILTAAAAEKAIPSLLGMGVNLAEKHDNHDVKRKIGVITLAEVKDQAVHIGGFIYASDFPEESARIRSDQGALGFSWELANIFVASVDTDPLVITDCAFTGAAILRKDKAAYSATSLSASAEEIEMTKEELAEVLAAAMAPVQAEIAGIKAEQTKMGETLQASAAVMNKVEPHAAALEAQADKMEGDGVGTDARAGHVKVLRNMASSMRASAAMGRVPASYSDGMYAAAEAVVIPATVKVEEDPAFKKLEGELAAAGTKIADLQAEAAKKNGEPERKTLSPAITALLAKADLTLPEGDAKMEASAVDVALAKVPGLTLSQRIATKSALSAAGRL